MKTSWKEITTAVDSVKEKLIEKHDAAFQDLGTENIKELESGDGGSEKLRKIVSQLKQLQKDMGLASPKDKRTLAVASEVERLSKLMPAEGALKNLSLPENFKSMSCEELQQLVTPDRMADVKRAYAALQKDAADGENAGLGIDDLLQQMTTKSALIAINSKVGAEKFEDEKLKPRALRLDSLPSAVQEELWHIDLQHVDQTAS
jgi:hypothetical protein